MTMTDTALGVVDVDERAAAIASIYRRAGVEMRIVGGAVRDWALGQDAKDIDLATPATPEHSIRLLQEAGVRVETTGLKHGTVSAIVDGTPFEITTLRAAHATAAFTDSWEADAARRDFTFNSMSLGFDGRLHDVFGGLNDLMSGRIRFVGGARQRIEEDCLRILRYFRFASRFRSELHAADLSVIAETAAGLKMISGERIQAEMVKLLSHGGEHVAEAMKATGVGDAIGLNLDAELCAGLIGESAETIIGAHLRRHPGGAATLDALRVGWRLSNETVRTLRFILAVPEDFNIEGARRALILDRVPPDRIDKAFAAAGRQAERTAWHREPRPSPPVSGKDMIDLGLAKGPEIGARLRHVLTGWVAGGCIETRDELIGRLQHQRP